jgi:hypothetical protein
MKKSSLCRVTTGAISGRFSNTAGIAGKSVKRGGFRRFASSHCLRVWAGLQDRGAEVLAALGSQAEGQGGKDGAIVECTEPRSAKIGSPSD